MSNHRQRSVIILFLCIYSFFNPSNSQNLSNVLDEVIGQGTFEQYSLDSIIMSPQYKSSMNTPGKGRRTPIYPVIDYFRKYSWNFENDSIIVQEVDQIVDYMVKNGADLNYDPGKRLNVPLLYAMGEDGSDTLMVEVLLKHGAQFDVSARQKYASPLEVVISSDANAYTFLPVFIRYGLDLDAPYEVLRDLTPMEWIVLSADQVQEASSILGTMVELGGDINQRSEDQTRSLMDLAMQQGNSRIMEILIAYGHDVNTRCPVCSHETYLHRAADYENEDLFYTLINNGAELNAVDDDGDTPLHWAINAKNKLIIEALLIENADINIKSNDGKSALDLLKERDLYEEFRDYLEDEY